MDYHLPLKVITDSLVPSLTLKLASWIVLLSKELQSTIYVYTRLARCPRNVSDCCHCSEKAGVSSTAIQEPWKAINERCTIRNLKAPHASFPSS